MARIFANPCRESGQDCGFRQIWDAGSCVGPRPAKDPMVRDHAHDRKTVADISTSTKLSNSLCLRISGMSCRRSTRRSSRRASRISEPHKRMPSCPRPGLAKNVYSRLGNLSGGHARKIMETSELPMTRSFIARNIIQTWPLTSVRRQIAFAEHVIILDISMPLNENLWA